MPKKAPMDTVYVYHNGENVITVNKQTLGSLIESGLLSKKFAEAIQVAEQGVPSSRSGFKRYLAGLVGAGETVCSAPVTVSSNTQVVLTRSF